MDSRQLIGKIKALNLPEEEYLVAGGAVLAIHGIRGCADIDIAVTPQVFADFKSRGWEEKPSEWGSRIFRRGDFEVGEVLVLKDYRPTFQELRARAEMFEGVPFASLEDTLSLKKALGREKDQEDILLIKEYLRSKTG